MPGQPALLSAEIPVARVNCIPVLAVTSFSIDSGGNCSGWVKVACGPVVVWGSESVGNGLLKPLCELSGLFCDESLELLDVELSCDESVEPLCEEDEEEELADPFCDGSIDPFCDGSMEPVEEPFC